MHGQIHLKNASELERMHRANKLVLTVLDELAAMAKPGVTTADLDRHAEKRILGSQARPAFKGYGGFPCSLCTSLNSEVVHGIPSSKCSLKEGDILSMDLGVVLDGFFGDSAMTVAIGEVKPEASRLIELTKASLRKGIAQVRAGKRVSDISRAIQEFVEAQGLGIVRNFVGHGIGRKLHEEPQVPNFVDDGTPRNRLQEGMVLAIEPMVTAGDHRVHIDNRDKWTAMTIDGSLSAHWERSVAVTSNGPRVLGSDEGTF